MRPHRILAGRYCSLTALLFVLPLLSCSPQQEQQPEIPLASALLPMSGLETVDREGLAQRLVVQSAGVREGDVVFVAGGLRDAELLEELAVQVRKAGAFPLVTFNTETMVRRMYDEVDPRYDEQTPLLDVKLAEIADVFISVDAIDAPDLLAHVPPARISARARAAEPVTRLMQERAVRLVNLGNQLYPTQALAERFGVTREELAATFWAGIDVDYQALSERGRAVQAVLAAGREVHITHPNGTDLRLRIDGRPSFVSDGVITEEDRQRGTAGSQVWLPAGEVYVTPVPGTAEGTLVTERYVFQGHEIQGLTLSFANGRLTDMTAAAGLEPLRAYYDAAGAGKDELGVLDIGFNPNVRVVPGSRMEAWVADGTVTLSLGGNVWAGGANTVPFGLAIHLTGATLSVDDDVLVDAGALNR